jgi:hypothetical protein
LTNRDLSCSVVVPPPRHDPPPITRVHDLSRQDSWSRVAADRMANPVASVFVQDGVPLQPTEVVAGHVFGTVDTFSERATTALKVSGYGVKLPAIRGGAVPHGDHCVLPMDASAGLCCAL